VNTHVSGKSGGSSREEGEGKGLVKNERRGTGRNGDGERCEDFEIPLPLGKICKNHGRSDGGSGGKAGRGKKRNRRKGTFSWKSKEKDRSAGLWESVSQKAKRIVENGWRE